MSYRRTPMGQRVERRTDHSFSLCCKTPRLKIFVYQYNGLQETLHPYLPKNTGVLQKIYYFKIIKMLYYKKKYSKTFSSFRKLTLYSRKLVLFFLYKTSLASCPTETSSATKKTQLADYMLARIRNISIYNGASQLCTGLILGIPILKTYFKNICCMVLLCAISAEPKSKQAADPHI